MKRSFLFFIPIIAIMMASCGNRPVKTEHRDTGSFSQIVISAPLDADITVKAGAPSVELSGPSNILERINTRVDGDVLEISLEEDLHFYTGNNHVTAVISVPSLSRMKLSGAADVEVKGEIAGPSFSLRVSGASEAKLMHLHAEEVTVDISGAGEVGVEEGSAQKVFYSVSGAGDIHAYGLQGGDVSAKVSGAGDIRLTANKTLDAHVSGAGSVSYKGGAVVTKDVSGAGDVKAVD